MHQSRLVLNLNFNNPEDLADAMDCIVDAVSEGEHKGHVHRTGAYAGDWSLAAREKA